MSMLSAIKKSHDISIVASPLLIFLVLFIPVLLVAGRHSWLVSALLLMAIIFLARGSKWLRIIIIPIMIVSILQVGYYLYSQREIDKFLWMAIESTEQAEAASYFSSLTAGQLLVLVAYVIVSVYLAYGLWRSKDCACPLEKTVAILVLATATTYISPVLPVITQQQIEVTGAPVNIVNSYYGRVVRSVAEARDFKLSSVPMRVMASSRGPVAQQILVVVGESASRLRMGVYGYARDTTPLVGDHAFIFRNNIAIGLNTQPNVQTLLTGLLRVPSTGVGQDIFRAAKSAQYESVVIDNNGYKNDDPIVRLSMEADHYISMNGVGVTSSANDRKIKHDKVVLRPFTRQVKLFGNGRALYVVHLIGSHPTQDLRYPDSFNKFPSYYDNSILYTDYILYRLRRIFMRYAKGPSVMIYVSDHGVRLPPGCGMGKVPDPENVSYGANDKYFSNYAIPLIVWINEDFRRDEKNIVDNLNMNLIKPIDQRFLVYSVSQLMGIQSINNINVRGKSIFSASPNFEPRLNNFSQDMEEMFTTGKVCVAKPIAAYWKSGAGVGMARR